MMKEGYSGRAVAAAGALGGRRKLGLVPRVGFDDDEAVVAEDGRKVLGKPVLQGRKHLIGWIDQQEIVAVAGGGLGGEGSEGVLLDDPGAVEAELVEIPVDRAAGFAVVLDEDDARRSARECLETHRARTGEEVEHGRAV